MPQKIDVAHMEDKVTVRFRVGEVFRGKSVALYYDGKLIRKQKKRVMAPGEMEEIVLTKASFDGFDNVGTITVAVVDQ